MFGFPYSTHLPMLRIYCCFIHFILFLLYRSLYEVEGGILVSPYLACLWTESCPLCIFHNISHIHFTTNFRRCVSGQVLWKIPKFEFFANFFQFTPFALSCVHVMWMLKVHSSSGFLLQQLFIFRNDTSRWFIKHTFRVCSKLQFCIFVIFFQLYLFT